MLFFCSLIFRSIGCLFSQTPDTLKPKNVLLLYSLESGTPAYENMIEKIKRHVRQEFKHPVNFYYDFIGMVRLNDDKTMDDFFEYYNKKYSGMKIDLFISMGPDLYPLIEKYGSPLLDSIPKIYFEVYSLSSDVNYNIHGNNKTIIYLDIEPEKNLQVALHLFPNTKNIFVVTGISEPEKKYLYLIKATFKVYENNFNIFYLPGITINPLLNKLNNFSKNSILFLPLFQKDSGGTIYYNKEMVDLISSNSVVPVFPIFDVSVEGSAGGLLVSTSEIGEKIGDVSVRILEGEDPDSIGIYHSNFSYYMFDWKQLRRWGIDKKNIPEGSIIINREYTFIEEYYPYLIAGIVFIVLETILLVFLLIYYKKQKRQSITIKEQERRYKALVDFDRLSKLGELTAAISHQLNQPLTAILTSSQASLRFIKNDRYEKEMFKEILDNIVEDVKRASEIIKSLRSMIKKEIAEKKRVNINKISNDVILLFSGEASIHDIIMETELDTKEPMIYADSILIQQVILNLLHNAAEALKNQTKGTKRICFRTLTKDDCVTISVSDNGAGIEDSVKDKIFNPFFTTKHSGLGIGLAICRSIIEDHEGKIKFENNESGGATFSLTLKTI